MILSLETEGPKLLDSKTVRFENCPAIMGIGSSDLKVKCLSRSKRPSEEQIRRSCAVLELEMEGVTQERIVAAWKKLIVKPSPALTPAENDAYLFSLQDAKQILLDWIEESTFE